VLFPNDFVEDLLYQYYYTTITWQKNWKILVEQSFSACMPLLMATGAKDARVLNNITYI